MAFNDKEQQIIKYGLENGKSQAEVEQAILRLRRGEISQSPQAPAQQQEQPGFFSRARDAISKFAGTTELGQGLGQTLAQPALNKQLEGEQAKQFEIQGQLIQRIRDKKEKGEDVSRLEQALKLLSDDIAQTGQGAEQALNPFDLSAKKVAGSGIRTAATIVGAGQLPGNLGQATKAATTASQGFKQGAVITGLEGLLVGTAEGAGRELQKEGSAKEVAKTAAIDGAIGLGLGIVIGGTIGAISGHMRGRALAKATGDPLVNKAVNDHISTAYQQAVYAPDAPLYTGQIDASGNPGILDRAKENIVIGLRSSANNAPNGAAFNRAADAIEGLDISKFDSIQDFEKTVHDLTRIASTDPSQLAVITARQADEAYAASDRPLLSELKKQGVEQADIDVLSTLDPETKKKALQMFDVAEEATKNKRLVERPIDIAGESFLDRVNFAQSVKSKAGKAVNEAAESLRGSQVSAQPVKETFDNLLRTLDVGIDPSGALDFSNSALKDTTSIQNSIAKIYNDIPNGDIDAKTLHIIKKRIDNLVDFGTAGEGLKGQSEAILKAVRRSADDVLDTTFPNYKVANDDFRAAANVLDQVKQVFGKRFDPNSARAAGEIGQKFRSLFSNNQTRNRLLQLITDSESFGNQFNAGFKDSPHDLAIVSQMIENIFGTEATTSLQGEVAKAFKNTNTIRKIASGNILESVPELAMAVSDKVRGISSEAKVNAIKALLKFIK